MLDKASKYLMYMLPLTIFLLSWSYVPNRIVILALVLISFFNYKTLIQTKGQVISLITVAVLAIGTKFTTTVFTKDLELLIFLPLYYYLFKTYKVNSSTLAKMMVFSSTLSIAFLVIMKLWQIVSFGVLPFFNSFQWWNNLVYKNLVSVIDGHPTYVSFFVIISLVFLTEESFKIRSSLRNWLVAVHLVFIMFLSAKIGLLATAVIFIVRIFKGTKTLSFKRVLTISMILLISVVIGFAVPSLRHRLTNDYIKLTESSENVYNTNSKFSERLTLWKASIIKYKKRPLIGYSMDNKRTEDIIYEEGVKINPNLKKGLNAHNNFLEWAMKYGVFGIIIMVLANYYFFNSGFKINDWSIVYLGVLFFLFSLTESYLSRQQGVAIYCIGILFTKIKLDESDLSI